MFRTLNALNKYSRNCLAISAKRRLNSTDLISVTTGVVILPRAPAYNLSDNSPESAAQTVRDGIAWQI
ncbi:MAG: hypothetical protein AAGF50_07325 [Pseudomonadota bacterium]